LVRRRLIPGGGRVLGFQFLTQLRGDDVDKQRHDRLADGIVDPRHHWSERRSVRASAAGNSRETPAAISRLATALGVLASRAARVFRSRESVRGRRSESEVDCGDSCDTPAL